MEDSQDDQRQTPAEAEAVREARMALLVLVRAQDLQRSSGIVPSENMTLEEAISVLEKHGEDAWLEHVEPIRIIKVPEG
jgi:phage/plasmid-associated DNA primase